MYCELFPTLTEETLLLTANSRLSRYLQQAYAEYQQQQNIFAWHTPRIIPLNAWLIEQWQQCQHATGLLLSENEETLLWQSIINKDQASALLLQVNKAAMLAKQAWQTLQLWKVKLNEVSQDNIETTHFIQWANQFEFIKQTNNFYSQAELPATVTVLIDATHLTLPKSIILVGFDDFNPALQHLLKVMGSHCELTHCTTTLATTRQQRFALQNVEQEIKAMALWSHELLPTLKPNEQIGCIVPNLNHLRPRLQRLFTEQFAPQNLQPSHQTKSLPFNISSGENLSHVCLIQTALNVLKQSIYPEQRATYSAVLLSPYINSTTEDQALAAMVETKLVDFSDCKNLAVKIDSLLCQLQNDLFPHSTLKDRWQQWLETEFQQTPQTFADWCGVFSKALTAIGWPGSRTLSSYEHQAMLAWQKILEEFYLLDRLLPPLSVTAAYAVLTELCHNSIFQPQTADTPIQVLGLLEASGCHFKHLWLMGLNAEEWPPKAEPNPFLPLNLQRELNMPHASAKREYAYCQNIQDKLFHSAFDVVASYSLFEDDRQLQPSPLILALSQSHNPMTPITPEVTRPLEALHDDFGPAVLPQELISGGSQIFQLQALCPFRAFASLRLKAEPLQSENIGLDAMTQGNACHLAMENVWREIRDQQTLLNLPAASLNQLIHSAVVEACKIGYPSLYWEVERERLNNLLAEWLEVEKQRPAFKVVQRESQRHIQIGPLKLRIQIDRIDTLENGQQLIIDYKTGLNNSIEAWFGQRLEQPQLPIYAAYGHEHSCGIAYAEVNLASLTFKGIIDQAPLFSKMLPLEKAPTPNTTWINQQNEWRAVLEKLSEEFYQGEATVDPLNAKTCTQCKQQPLCRIAEKEAS